jgi:HK97 family phage prohead protease
MTLTPTRYPDGSERRAAVELRATSGRKLEGYAAVFNTAATIGGAGGFRETIKPGAFRASLLTPGRDVLALVDHDPTRLLARTANRSLRLAEDSRGLHFELDVPTTSTGNDALALVEAGLAGGMSFGFRATDEAWPAADKREIRAADLIEISLVSAFPAYGTTTVAARSAIRDAMRCSAAARIRAMRLAVL